MDTLQFLLRLKILSRFLLPRKNIASVFQ